MNNSDNIAATLPGCVAAAGSGASAPDRVARSPELELLLHCARAEAIDGDRVRSLAREGVDWDALAEAAEYHGLAPILYRAVDGACPDLVPEHVARRLRNRYRDSARSGLILTARLLALLDAFEAEGIAVMPLKGPVLAESLYSDLYSDPGLRPFSDLDLLVRKRDVAAALRLLTREGYTFGSHLARLPVQTVLGLNSEIVLRHPQGMQVDLQWGVAPADYPFSFDPEILWRSLRPARVAGREVPGMGLENLLLFLCVHGAKHMWPRLMWLGDIARLARRNPDWVVALELATEAGCARPVLLGLLLAHDLLDAAVPEAIVERARAEAVIQPLARQVELRLRRIPPAEAETLERTAFNAKMAERMWHKVRHYGALLRAPAEADLQVLYLPPKLFFLYYPVRAVRMGVKYLPRLVRGRLSSAA